VASAFLAIWAQERPNEVTALVANFADISPKKRFLASHIPRATACTPAAPSWQHPHKGHQARGGCRATSAKRHDSCWHTTCTRHVVCLVS
jgi:hypothetical protein